MYAGYAIAPPSRRACQLCGSASTERPPASHTHGARLVCRREPTSAERPPAPHTHSARLVCRREPTSAEHPPAPNSTRSLVCRRGATSAERSPAHHKHNDRLVCRRNCHRRSAHVVRQCPCAVDRRAVSGADVHEKRPHRHRWTFWLRVRMHNRPTKASNTFHRPHHPSRLPPSVPAAVETRAWIKAAIRHAPPRLHLPGAEMARRRPTADRSNFARRHGARGCL